MKDGGIPNARKGGEVIELKRKSWYLVGIRAAKVKMRIDQTNEITDGTQIALVFEDQKPSPLITKNGRGQSKSVQFAIPNGVPADAVYQIFEQLPDVIRKHLEDQREPEPEKQKEA